jgi:hypothetical protein
MSLNLLRLVAATALIAQATAAHGEIREFRVRAADGVEIHGVAEAGGPRPRLAVIFVAGTGLFDRDGMLGASGTPRDLIFKDLAGRMAARGIATVRYDMRGVRYGTADRADRLLLAGRTTITMRDDLAAVYQWSRADDGLGATCVAFFAHSEGMLHVARLTDIGTPPPALVIGMGAGMESPAEIVRWQISGRDADSLIQMDADQDGVTTNDEIRQNLARTPSGVHGKLEPYLRPSGAWQASDIAALRATQQAIYDHVLREVLTHADAEPYPSAAEAFASYQWWKSWFVDTEPAARLLARWGTRISLHYGDRDSQTPAARQVAAARTHLPADRLTTAIYPGRGHTLGESVILGPVDEPIAEKIADEVAAAAATCAPR